MNDNVSKGMKMVLFAIAYFTLVFLSLFLVPESVKYAKDGITNVLPFLLAMFAFPALLEVLARVFPRKKMIFRMLIKVSIVVLPAVMAQDHYRSDRIEAELKAEGTRTQGVVSQRTLKSSKTFSSHQITLSFSANGEEYLTFEQNDEKDEYREGDSLEVIYLERNPEISRVIVFEDAW